MAAVLDQISIATIAMHGDLNSRLLSRDSAALRMMQEDARRRTGDPINVKVRYKRNNGGSYSGFDQFNVTRVSQFAEGTLQWKSIYVNVTIDESTLVRNAAMNLKDLMSINDIRRIPARDRQTIFNLFGEEMAGALDDMQTLQAEQLWSDGTGNGGKDMTGLLAIANSSTTHTYAGISGDELGTFDYTGSLSAAQDNLWAARYKTNANAGVTLDLLGDALNDCNQGGSDVVTEVYEPLDIYTSIELQLEGQKTRPNDRAAAIGFRQNVEWVSQGCTFFPDPYCPANTILGINSRHTYMLKHPALDVEFSGEHEEVALEEAA